MIVISGALVAVALLLLVVGLTVTTLSLIYASIAVSGLSLAFLLLGIYQRRGDLPATAVAPPQPEGEAYPSLTALPERPPIEPRRTGTGVGLAQPKAADLVLIVAGRPRYHADGCRYLTGKAAEQVTVEAAQAEGFTACVVCKPTAGTSAPVVPPTGQPSDSRADLVDPDPQSLERGLPLPVEVADPAQVVPAARVPVARRTQPLGRVVGQPVRPEPEAGVPSGTPLRVQPVPVQPVPVRKVAAAVRAPVRTPAKRAVVLPVLPAVEVPGAPQPVDVDRVVVIADRTKFHLSDCRFVRAAADTSLVTRKAAGEQGFVACGVCKP